MPYLNFITIIVSTYNTNKQHFPACCIDKLAITLITECSHFVQYRPQFTILSFKNGTTAYYENGKV